MNRHVCRIAVGALLALGIWSLTTAQGLSAGDDDKEILEAQKAIVQLTDMLGKNPAGAAQAAEAIAKKYELGTAMQIFKPRNKKGLGVGEKPGEITPDGIELKIISLGKRALPATTLKQQAPALVRMCEVSKAMGELAKHYQPPKKAGSNPANWKKYSDDEIKASDDLSAAVKGGNPITVRKAADNLNASCNNCHTDFRV